MKHACANGHDTATHCCIGCGIYLCADCVVPLPEHRVVKCPECGDMAKLLPDTSRLDAGFLAEVPAALLAPFTAPASFVFWLGGGLMCAAFSFYWIHPLAGAAAATTVALYFNAYAASVANVTAQGLAEDAYAWDLSGDWFNLLFFPSVRACLLVGAGATIAATAFDLGSWAGAVALAIVLAWLPIAWLRVALTEHLLDAIAPSTFSAIVAMRFALVASLGSLCIIVVPVGAFWTMPSAWTLLGAPFVGYGFIVGGRLTGLAYFHRAQDVDWFGESARYYTPVR